MGVINHLLLNCRKVWGSGGSPGLQEGTLGTQNGNYLPTGKDVYLNSLITSVYVQVLTCRVSLLPVVRCVAPGER